MSLKFGSPGSSLTLKGVSYPRVESHVLGGPGFGSHGSSLESVVLGVWGTYLLLIAIVAGTIDVPVPHPYGRLYKVGCPASLHLVVTTVYSVQFSAQCSV